MKAFISYSHHDAELLTKLHEHLAALRREKLLETWTDREIPAGGVIDSHVEAQLEDADVYLLLVSSAFINSHYCFEREFQHALGRQEKGLAIIVPIIVRDCDWKIAALRQFKALPDDGKPVMGRDWHNTDEAFTRVANGLRHMIESRKAAKLAETKKPKDKKVKFTADESHVSDDQRKTLRGLCDEVVDRLTAKAVLETEEVAKRRRGKFFGIVWAQFNEHFQTPELAALKRERFEEARSWFLQYRASKDKNLKRLNPQKYRNTLTKTIHTLRGTLGWSKEQLYAFASEKLKYPNAITSLDDLGNEKLELVRDRVRYEDTKRKAEKGQAAARTARSPAEISSAAGSVHAGGFPAKPRKVTNTAVAILPDPTEFSTLDFFQSRVTDAFPGLRGVRELSDPHKIAERLAIILRKPLVYQDANERIRVTPLWWWGRGNHPIRSFRELDGGRILIDEEEYLPRRLAVVNRFAARQTFIYIETEGEPSCGAYTYQENEIKNAAESQKVISEEYGLFRGRVVRRAEFDDDGAEIDGQVVRFKGKAELRHRFLTPYNFLIAPQKSPINNSAFDRRLEELLTETLKAPNSLGQLIDEVLRLPLRSE